MDFTTKHNNSALQVAVVYFYDPFMFGCFLKHDDFLLFFVIHVSK